MTRRPDFDSIALVYNVFEMVTDSLIIRRFVHALGDIEEDACEAIFTQVHLLVVGNLAEFARNG